MGRSGCPGLAGWLVGLSALAVCVGGGTLQRECYQAKFTSRPAPSSLFSNLKCDSCNAAG